MSKAYFIGIDIGTQGARVIIMDEQGHQLDAKEERFELDERSREEQSPENWWQSCSESIAALIKQAKEHINLLHVKAIAVTSTSGTIIPVDENNKPLHSAIMYSDQRSSAEAISCKEAALANNVKGYTAFNTSSGLPKMLWLLNNFPKKLLRLAKFIHAADFVTGKLCGVYGVTDYTNALKSGYDIHQFKWPEYITEAGVPTMYLQEVKPSGSSLAFIQEELAIQWGLPKNVQVTTGITDGCASQIASGAVSPGEWNTTIGTTLVIKGVTIKEITDPVGAIYNHRHPDGYWMPGGASNTGADWVTKLFGKENLDLLNKAAYEMMPTGITAWPLLQPGERFPFVSPDAKGFWPEAIEKERLFTACMEGVAYIERYAYEQIKKLSGESISSISSAGGGSNSEAWLRIRSAVLNLPINKMKNVSGAAGAAVLAASRTYYSSLVEAAEAMVHPEKTIQPDPVLVNKYSEAYDVFIKELEKRKIIPVEKC